MPRLLAATVVVAMGAVAAASPAVAIPAPPGQGSGVGAHTPQDWPGNTANPYGGTDYYLDATGGDDAQPGTSPGTAWRTLAKANDTTFEPGDRVLLKAGEEWHNEQLWPKGSGEQGRPIAIDAYGDIDEGRPYIATNGQVQSPFTGSSGTTKDPQKVGLTGAVVLRNQQYWEIANLELSNDDDFATDITSGRYVRDGVAISINADLLGADDDKIMDHFRISNLYVHNIDGPSSWQQIHYGGIVFQVFGSQQYRQYETGAYYFKDVRIEDNTLENVELHAIEFAFNWFYDRDSSSGQYDETGKYHEGWEQYWVRDRDLYSRDVYIGHNYAKDIGQGAIQLANTRDMVVEYNEVNGYLQRYNAVSCGLYLWAGADTVMQFNEVYGGPYNEYDGTPWDLEYTNFNVTYQYNYSHDNAAGWMSYMGNSSNSIARYNLSVNENGVLVKNMLSTNYSPTYFLNNVFIYDGAEMDYFHDEVFKDTVYFLNNVFYNTSETTTTPWYRRTGALNKAVFSNNAFYEASGTYSAQQPADDRAVIGDPGFASSVEAYKVGNGVLNIADSASVFALKADSPLIDAGRYNPRLGSEDFFGTPVYFGAAPDIGIQEVRQGTQIVDPEDTDPVEGGGSEERVNLALGKPITASVTHPHNNYYYSADKLVDGDPATRWAAPDFPAYPIEIIIDFEEPTTFDEVYLAEFIDHQTNPRVKDWKLQGYDTSSGAWTTFAQGSDGIGPERTVKDFAAVTSSRLRLLIESQLPTETWSPTMTEIGVYYSGGAASTAEPSLVETTGLFDLNPAVRTAPNNTVSYGIDLDGAKLAEIRYLGTEGNVLGSLGADDYTADSQPDGVERYALSAEFLASRAVGESGLRFEFDNAEPLQVSLVVVDTTELVAQLDEAAAVPPAEPGSPRAEAYAELQQAIAEAQAMLAQLNRDRPGTGNDTALRQAELDQATADLLAAVIYAVVDRSALQEAHDAVAALDADAYTSSSWSGSASARAAALTNAETVLADRAATATEIDEAVEALSVSIAGLVLRGDSTVLQAMIAVADGLTAHLSAFTDDSAAVLRDALEAAKQVHADRADRSQDQLDATVTALQSAIGGLTVRPPVTPAPPDRTVLQHVFDSAKTLSNSDGRYTAASWSQLQSEIARAKLVIDDGSATQARLDQATKELSSALAGLVPVQEEPNPGSFAPVVSKVKLNQSQLRLVKGKSFRLEEGVYFTNVHPAYSGAVTWKSSNPKIATVSSGGTVKAKKAGTVKITVTTVQGNASGKKLSTTITVVVVGKKPASKVTKVSASVP
ncbi:MAG: Ig-like domain-containing protein, partial [Propionibacteriaceae bacterium]|nr:Ig-like domain-containing protein [Propionibacteriaceae bacterium]